MATNPDWLLQGFVVRILQQLLNDQEVHDLVAYLQTDSPISPQPPRNHIEESADPSLRLKHHQPG